MPTYLELLPEDILAHVYRLLYKSVLNDMKKDGKYKNMLCFDKLLDISRNPYIDNLDYRGLVIRSCINDIIDKYSRCHFITSKTSNTNLLAHNIIYYKSYYIKPLESCINKIEIFNFYICNLYNDAMGDTSNNLASFNKTYFARSFKGMKMGISKKGFLLEKDEPFSCLADLLYYTIELYDFAKQNLYMNIQLIEQIGAILTLSPAKRKEQDDLVDILNYHCSHRYLEGMLYDLEYKCAKPKLE